MKYKVTLNKRVYEVEVEKGEAMLVDEYDAVAPVPVAAPAPAPVAAAAPAPAAAAPRASENRSSAYSACSCIPCRFLPIPEKNKPLSH